MTASITRTTGPSYVKAESADSTDRTVTELEPQLLGGRKRISSTDT